MNSTSRTLPAKFKNASVEKIAPPAAGDTYLRSALRCDERLRHQRDESGSKVRAHSPEVRAMEDVSRVLEAWSYSKLELVYERHADGSVKKARQSADRSSEKRPPNHFNETFSPTKRKELKEDPEFQATLASLTPQQRNIATLKKIKELYDAEVPEVKNSAVLEGVRLVPYESAVTGPENSVGLLWEAVRAKEVRDYDDGAAFAEFTEEE
jgi:hypothetical protein